MFTNITTESIAVFVVITNLFGMIYDKMVFGIFEFFLKQAARVGNMRLMTRNQYYAFMLAVLIAPLPDRLALAPQLDLHASMPGKPGITLIRD